MDETAKELLALISVTDSSLASSLRPSDETQEQLERSSQQARIAKKGVEALQDLSYLFQKEHCERQRNGFLQVRTVKIFTSRLAHPMCKPLSERRDASNGTSG